MKQEKLTNEEIGELCLALAHLYHAGIGMGDAFALMAADQERPEFAKLYSVMARQADDGSPLSGIFRESGRFPDYVCALLEVGERVGKSEETLNALARYYEGRSAMSRRLRTALLYPSVLVCVLLAVVVVLLVWVLPVFNDVYARLGSGLGGFAGGLLAVGAGLRKIMPLLCVLLAAAVVFAILAALSANLRAVLLSFWRGYCGDKGISRKINSARFAQALAMGLCSGLTDREAVDLAAGLSDGSDGFRLRCERCLKKLEEGGSLSAALRESELLSRADCRLLEAGIRSGHGADVMEQIALRLMEEGEGALESLTGKIEPALVLLMSVMVGIILLSVMLPLMHIMTAIG